MYKNRLVLQGVRLSNEAVSRGLGTCERRGKNHRRTVAEYFRRYTLDDRVY